MEAILFAEHELVMIRINKTGSTSIIRGIFGSQDHGNVVWGEFPEQWQSYSSFAFVRNPFDRLISAYFMFKSYPRIQEHEKHFQTDLTLDRMMDHIEDDQIEIGQSSFLGKLRMHSIPITHSANLISFAKQIYRFEEFDKSYREIYQRVHGTTPDEIAHFKKKNRSPYQEHFSDQQRQRAEAIFQEDLKQFGYQF